MSPAPPVTETLCPRCLCPFIDAREHARRCAARVQYKRGTRLHAPAGTPRRKRVLPP